MIKFADVHLYKNQYVIFLNTGDVIYSNIQGTRFDYAGKGPVESDDPIARYQGPLGTFVKRMDQAKTLGMLRIWFVLLDTRHNQVKSIFEEHVKALRTEFTSTHAALCLGGDNAESWLEGLRPADDVRVEAASSGSRSLSPEQQAALKDKWRREIAEQEELSRQQWEKEFLM